MIVDWFKAFMPLVTGIAVSIIGFTFAKWYENRKERRRIRDDLVQDLTELERKFFQLGLDWNKWVEFLVILNETEEVPDGIDFHKERLQDNFIDFEVQLNKLYGKLNIYLKWPTLDDLTKKIKKKETVTDPLLMAFGTLIVLSSKIQESIDEEKLTEEQTEIKNRFLEMRLILTSFYPEILTRKVRF